MPAANPQGIVRDTQFYYMLECGVELGEITPLEAAVFYADTPAAHALSEALNGRNQPDHFMRNTARAYLNQCTKKERLVWSLKGLDGAAFALSALTERMDFVLQKKIQGDLGLDERNRISFLYELTDVAPEDVGFFKSVHDITPDKVLQYLEPRFGSVRQMIQEDLELAVEALEWLKQPGARAEARAVAETLFSRLPQSVDLPYRTVSAKLAKVKKVRNQARGAIKKAMALFTRMGMEKSVQMLVSGETVKLSHPDSPFMLVVAPIKGGWLEEKTVNPGGHVPFNLSVHTKAGVFLTRLCVLFNSTPVLDQLLALSMFVQTGNEMELLQKANWFGYEDAQKVREILTVSAPDLLHKMPAPRDSSKADASSADGAERQYSLSSCPDLQRLNALNNHWEPFKAPVGMWLKDWFGPVARTLELLNESGPVPRIG